MCPNQDDGRLDIYYDYSALARHVSKRVLSRRSPSVWKYHEFLPVEKEKFRITLGEGGTPLLPAKNLAKKIGLKTLYLKDETRNPTASLRARILHGQRPR